MRCRFVRLNVLILLSCTIHLDLVSAKFSHVYPGIAQAGFDACLKDPNYNLTAETIVLRENARNGFACIMKNIAADGQSILSSGPSIVGLIPTAVTLLGNRRADLITIHTYFPVLAFLLTFAGITLADDYQPISSYQWTPTPSEERKESFRRYKGLWNIDPMTPRATKRIFKVLHVFSVLTVVLLLWQTYDLSLKTVVSWSCWTSFWPYVWLLLGPLAHIVGITALKVAPNHSRLGYVLNIASSTCLRVQFLAGTAILGSLALVGGVHALMILSIYGGIAVIMRECGQRIIQYLSKTDQVIPSDSSLCELQNHVSFQKHNSVSVWSARNVAMEV